MNDFISWSPGVTLDDIEKQVILRAFRFYRGVKTVTAQALGISIRTLDHKLEKYLIDVQEQEKANEQQRINRESFLARQRGNVQISPETGASVLGPKEGFRMEPASEASAQLDMPMPKRKEVQTVLPGQTPQSGTGKRR